MTALLHASGFRERLVEELRVELPQAPLTGLAVLSVEKGAAAVDVVFPWIDIVVRQAGAAALVALGKPEAGSEVQGLAPIRDDASARQTMMALEKIGRRHMAPSAFMRALGGAPSTLLLLARVPSGDEERAEAAVFQILVAGVRLLGMSARAGVAQQELVTWVTRAFAGGAETSTM